MVCLGCVSVNTLHKGDDDDDDDDHNSVLSMLEALFRLTPGFQSGTPSPLHT